MPFKKPITWSCLKKHVRELLFCIIPKKTLYTTREDNIRFDVKNTIKWIPGFPEQRLILVNQKGFYSSIYVDYKHRRQPYLQMFQDTIETWAKNRCPKHALILGSAGCALHRFLALTYNEIMIDGVEVSATMISVAERFFLDHIRNNINLIKADAFEFVANIRGNKQYDIIIIDLFKGNQILSQVYSMDFLSNICSCCSPNALMLFNLFGDTEKEVLLMVSRLKKIQPNMQCIVKNEGNKVWLICS